MKLNLKTILSVHAVIFLIYGVMDLFAAESAISTFVDSSMDSPALTLMVRMMGGTFISLAILTWFLRDAELSYGRRAGLFSLAAGSAIAAILQIMAITAGTLNEMNWIGVLISLLFGIVYIYYGNREHRMIVERDANKQKAKAKA